MNSYKRVLLAALLILISYPSFSQAYSRGYIFGNNGDTISGFIETPPMNRAVVLCLFKPALRDTPTAMTARDIKGFGFDNNVYISTLIHLPKADTLVFTKLVYDDLFDLMYFEAYSTKHFIVRRPDSSLFGIQYPPLLTASELLAGLTADKKFKLQVDSIFPDAPELPEYQNGVKPEITSLNNLFRQYHNKPSSLQSRRIPLSTIHSDFKEGFIVNITGDTIEGLIGTDFKRTIVRECIFSPGKNENSVRFLPDDILGFGSRKENRIFVSATFTEAGRDTSVFVKLILDGSVDLLFFDSFGSKHFLLRDSQDKISSLIYPPVLSKKDYLSGLNSSKKFRIKADSTISAMNMGGSQKNFKPELKSILNYLEDYHSINGLTYRIFNGTQRNFEIGPVAGVRFENYDPQIKSNEYKAYSAPAPYAGLYLRTSNKKTGMGFSLRNTLSYHYDRYSYLIDQSSLKTYTSTTVKSLANSFEAGMTFSPLRTFIPGAFLEAGGATRYYISPEYETLINKVYSETSFVLSFRDTDIQNTKFLFGGFLRAGISRHFKTNNIGVSAGYNYLFGKSSVKVKSIDLAVIYTFRIR